MEISYYGSMVEDVYWNTGIISLTSTISTAFTTEASEKTIYSGKQGLMSAIDYGYATSEVTYNNVNLSSLLNYEHNNWLYKHDNEVTFTINSNYSQFYISYTGSLESSYDQEAVNRPVVYLKKSVYIINGTGTEENPYVIGI